MKRLLAFVALTAIAGGVQAQTPPWDTNTVRWDAPTTCADGRAVADACPITGYFIDRSTSSTGTYTQIGSVGPTTLSYSHTGAAAGTNCYRIRANSANGSSSISPTFWCTSNVQPLPPTVPNPPGNVRGVIALVTGANVSPAYRILADGSRSSPIYALVPVGTPCTGPVVWNYRGPGYRRVTVSAAHLVGTTDARNLAAPCA